MTNDRNVDTAPEFVAGLHRPTGRQDRAAVLGRTLPEDRVAFRIEPTDAGEAEAVIRQEDTKVAVVEDLRMDRSPGNAGLLGALLEAVFCRWPEVDRILVPDPAHCPAAVALAEEIVEGDSETRGIVRRSTFRQLPLLWHRAEAHVVYPTIRSAIGPADRLPPLRPPKPQGLLYERWQPDLDRMLSFRMIDRKRDLDLFHGWMNQGRVSFFWELAKPKDELDAYLARQQADPHIFGVIGAFDDEPVGYFEFYWAKEDRLGPYYDARDYDRGWHGLIGNPRHLGRAKTLAWFRSLTHYLFLDDPRTDRVVGEPRASHVKMLSYAADVGYDKVKEFDFPHKRSALMCCERNRFFTETPL